MTKKEIKRIMIVHNNNDFVRVWDWIGLVTLSTIKNKNDCYEEMLEQSEDIEKFIKSLLPTAIEFVQYRIDKFASFSRYKDIENDELKTLTEYLIENTKFKYNFSETDSDWVFGGSETLIIDLENNISYTR